MTPLRSLLIDSLLIAVLTACSGGAPASSVVPPEADPRVTAEGNVFDAEAITLTAAETNTLSFTNLDGQPHNIAIYADESAQESLFVGEMITDDAITYEIPALEPGEYFFRCDAHPAMTGTVVVEG